MLPSWLQQSFTLSSEQVTELILYSTSACHLCEQAEVLLLNTVPHYRFILQKVDIAMDDALVEQYGHSIPVLVKVTKNATRIELFWPFDENKIIHFLSIV